MATAKTANTSKPNKPASASKTSKSGTKPAKAPKAAKAPVKQNTPLSAMKAKFGDKKSLVEAVEKFTSEDLWVARTNKDKGLAHVSNAKLLRLLSIFTEVKDKFGSRDKLVDAILELTKRGRDEGYKAALSKFPVPRLFDLYKSSAKRSKANGANGASGKAAKSEKPADGAAAKKQPASKKTAAAKKA